ncbi:MAG TPA: carboxypeptidase regulatory-like domain-containing protein [Blastocatellia bacterium]|nr:carboxypeptidase regulatory-like domain-containing protein [Blastocatellia bacterium]
MRIRNIVPAFAVCALLVISALAQTGRIEGDIKNEKGEPIVGADVVIVRTDIKGEYPVKTDKKGHYLHAGVPFVGTYTLLISAPGYRPDYIAGLRPDRPIDPITLHEGDGSKLTIEQVRQAQASAKQQPAGAKPMSEAEMKKQQEEYNKKKKEIEDYKSKFDEMKKHFDAGREMLAKNDYNGAATELNEAVKLDPDQNQHVIIGTLAIALYNKGVTEINAGQKDPAKQDFTDSAAMATKAVTLMKTTMSDPAKANDPALKKNLAQYVRSQGDANAILATKFGDAAAADVAATAYKEAINITDDPADKKKLLLKRAGTLRDASRTDEAIAAYKDILQSDPDNLEALYSLGTTYAGNEKTWQDSANTLQVFVDKAPDNDPRKAEAKAVIGELLKGNNIQPPKSEKGSSSTRKKKP